MTITFNEITKDLLTPGGYIEFDNRRAGTLADKATLLLVGQMTGEGSASLNQISTIGSEAQAIELYGAGSMLHSMCRLALNNNKGLTLAAVPVAVPGTAKNWLVECADANADGTRFISINDQKVTIEVKQGDSADHIASALAERINSAQLVISAEANAAELTITHRHNGEAHNDAWLDVAAGLTLNSTVAGSGTPDLSDMINALGDERYEYLVNPYTDTANLTKLQNECERRWQALVMNGIRVFYVTGKNYADALSFAKTQNSSHFTSMTTGDDAIQPAWHWATVLASIATDHLENDPAAPLTDVKLPGILPPKSTRFTQRQQDDFLHNGLSTWRVVVDSVQISYLVTNYRINAQGYPDSSYRDIQVPEILRRMRRQQIFRAMKVYSGYKLAKDASVYAAGQKIIDPDEMKGFLVSLYKNYFQRELGWVQDYKHYKDSFVIEIDPDNHDRMNFTDQPTLIGQFRVLAGQTQFIDR